MLCKTRVTSISLRILRTVREDMRVLSVTEKARDGAEDPRRPLMGKAVIKEKLL